MSEIYTSAGTYTYNVPAGAVELIISAYGGRGANGTAQPSDTRDAWDPSTGSGGNAGSASFAISTGELSDSLTVEVGGNASGTSGGQNGGGDGGSETPGDEVIEGGGGGGMSRIRDGSEVIAVAGGGGGGGAALVFTSTANDESAAGSGGSGDGGNGFNVSTSRTSAGGGGGGSESSGGGGGSADGDFSENGNSASGGFGADGVSVTNDTNSNSAASGAGGAGFNGGGSGGAAQENRDASGAGGGGGASFVINDATDVSIGSSFTSGRVEIETVEIEVTQLSADYIGSQEVDLSWSAENAEEYDIERNGVLIDTVSQETYTDTGISENTQTTYDVFAVLSDGTRADSDSITLTTGGPPENATATEVGDVEFEIAADEPNGDYEQVTLRRDSFLNEGDPELLTETQDASGGFSYTDTDGSLLPGVEYDYQLTATYRTGESSVNSAFGLVELERPTDLAVVEETPEGAVLSFTDNAGFRTEYRIYAFEDGEPGELFDTNDEALVEKGGTAEVEFGGLLNGKEYTVTVSVATPDTEAFDE